MSHFLQDYELALMRLVHIRHHILCTKVRHVSNLLLA